MPDFLKQAFAGDTNLVWTDILFRQAMALLFGCVVAWVYSITRGAGPERRSIITTLVLLTILIGTISSVIGDNVARAFSLVGALSIVRFRTVVEDTRDTAFVILAVGVGMAVGTGHLIAAMAVIPTALIAARLFGGRPTPSGSDYRVVVLTTLGIPEESLLAVLNPLCYRVEVKRVASARQGSAVETEFRILTSTGPRVIHEKLSAIDGVISAEVDLA